MPLESMNLNPVSSAHRVVSTDSLIMPIVSGRLSCPFSFAGKT